MTTISDRIAALIREHAPFAYCCACLARQLNLEEGDVRNAVQRLLVSPQYQVRRLACENCKREDTVVRFASGN